LKKGFIARGGQIIDTSPVPAPKAEKTARKENKLLSPKATPLDWKPAKRRQKDSDASWIKKHGKNHYGYKLVNQHRQGIQSHPKDRD